MKKYSENKTNRIISKSSNEGATMIVIIIIMTILIVFTFSLTLVAYTLYASQNKNIASLKCSEAANSLSIALTDEITYTDDANGYYIEDHSFLYNYLRYNICQDDATWPHYVSETVSGHDKKAACRYFNLKYTDLKKEVIVKSNGDNEKKNVDFVEGLPAKTVVCIYWMLPDDPAISTTTTGKELTSRDGIRLFIEVSSEAGNQAYTVKKEYKLKTSKYEPTVDSDNERYDILTGNKVKDDASINILKFSPADFDTRMYGREKWEWIPVVEE